MQIRFLCLLLFLSCMAILSCKTSQQVDQSSNTFNCKLPSGIDTISNHCEANFDCVFEHYVNSAVEVQTYQSTINSLQIIPGQQQVFKIERTYQDHPQIADDEFKENIHFSIDANAESFYFDSSNIRDCGLIYGKASFSRDRGFHVISDACLEGYKQNNIWRIQLYLKQQLRTGNTIEKSVQANFITKE